MSKTLVLVMTHPGAQPILDRNWPWILKCGCDVGIVYHKDPTVEVLSIALKKESLVNLGIGTDPDKMPHRWVSRFSDVLKWFVKNGPNLGYRSVCLVESDVIFIRPLPDHPGGMVATLAGHRSPGFHGRNYYHTPWWVSYKCAERILRWAERMLAAELDEQGFIDRFIGLMADLYPLQITNAHWYTQNTIQPEQFEEARTALERGAWGAHGVKDAETLAAITHGL